VRYSRIQLDTARYVRILRIQLYSCIQRDTAYSIHSGIPWICCKMARYRSIQGYTGDTEDAVRYRRDTGEIQAGDPKNTRQGEGLTLNTNTNTTQHQHDDNDKFTPLRKHLTPPPHHSIRPAAERLTPTRRHHCCTQHKKRRVGPVDVDGPPQPMCGAHN